MRVVVLEISSWVGTSPGARHCYATLHGYTSERRKYKRVRLEWKIDAAEARRRNTEDRERGYLGSTYRVGSKSEGFVTVERAHAEALAQWKRHFPKAELLVVGSWARCSPQRPLAGEPVLLRQARALWKQQQPIEDEHWDSRHDALSDVWMRLTR